MAITTGEMLAQGTSARCSLFSVSKGNVTATFSGGWCSTWRTTAGNPAQAAQPAAPSVLNNQTLGAITFKEYAESAPGYLASVEVLTTNIGTTVEIHDRLMEMGGLVGNSTALQTVGLDLSANLAVSNLAERIGDSNYSDVTWWLEWYTATGNNATVATIAVTFNDGTSGTLSALSLGTNRPATLAIPLNNLIPAEHSGKFIRAVNSIQLSVATASAGNFGVTATRYRASVRNEFSNFSQSFDWAALGLPRILKSSCLFIMALPTSTATGSINLLGRIAHG